MVGRHYRVTIETTLIDEPQPNLPRRQTTSNAIQRRRQIALEWLTVDAHLMADQTIAALPVKHQLPTTNRIPDAPAKWRDNGISCHLI